MPVTSKLDGPFRHADIHGQPSIDGQELQPIERRRRAEIRMIKTSKIKLRADHPSTLTSTNNLILTLKGL